MTYTVKPGDIFYTSWGYEQTNVEFYQVVRATSKTVWLAEIASEKESYGFMSEEVRPKLGIFKGDIFRRRLAAWANPDEPQVRIDDCANGYLWTGQSMRASHYA
ncbi:hypothetical protein [Rothia sp. (in: high G+C Gram-positive bacteria)]|uniref:hypothetical protein n=1 Tax=Rothia sp. (in: high G+C Gram-positive bacteria) TaxID=1885016 RepID=UPI0032173809